MITSRRSFLSLLGGVVAGVVSEPLWERKKLISIPKLLNTGKFHYGVDFVWNDEEKALNLREIEERYLKPAIICLAERIDRQLLNRTVVFDSVPINLRSPRTFYTHRTLPQIRVTDYHDSMRDLNIRRMEVSGHTVA